MLLRSAPTSSYSTPGLIRAIQQPQPEYDTAVLAVRAAKELVHPEQFPVVAACTAQRMGSRNMEKLWFTHVIRHGLR